MDYLNEYLLQEALIIIPALIILGKIFKETPNFKHWLIPYALLIVGVILSTLIIGLNVEGVIQGILVSGAAVFGYELYKNARERED